MTALYFTSKTRNEKQLTTNKRKSPIANELCAMTYEALRLTIVSQTLNDSNFRSNERTSPHKKDNFSVVDVRGNLVLWTNTRDSKSIPTRQNTRCVPKCSRFSVQAPCSILLRDLRTARPTDAMCRLPCVLRPHHRFHMRRVSMSNPGGAPCHRAATHAAHLNSLHCHFRRVRIRRRLAPSSRPSHPRGGSLYEHRVAPQHAAHRLLGELGLPLAQDSNARSHLESFHSGRRARAEECHERGTALGHCIWGVDEDGAEARAGGDGDSEPLLGPAPAGGMQLHERAL